MNKMMVSDVVGEDLVKFCRKIIEIMSYHVTNINNAQLLTRSLINVQNLSLPAQGTLENPHGHLCSCQLFLSATLHPSEKEEYFRLLGQSTRLLEVKDGYCFSISKQDFIECPLTPQIFGRYPQEHTHHITIAKKSQFLYISNNQLRILSLICQLKSIFLTNITNKHW